MFDMVLNTPLLFVSARLRIRFHLLLNASSKFRTVFVLQTTTWEEYNALRKQFLQKLCIARFVQALRVLTLLIFRALWSRLQK